MAKGGNARFSVSFDRVFKSLELVIDHVDKGTKKATLAAIKEIFDESQKQVPKDTRTLANSGYYTVSGNSKTSFVGIVGYGGNGNPINPKSGEAASGYMVQVHEDMYAHHSNGKAKFLEDPVKEYQQNALGKYARFIKNEIGMR
jgi:hypothetical protein